MEKDKEEESIIYNNFLDTNLIEEDYNNTQTIILFIAEFMSLSLKDKISKYLSNKYIRSIKNPVTSDTLLHYLCMNDDNLPLIQLINPNSIEKEQQNKNGQTLLHIATQNKSYKIIEYLLENGSNINSKDINNNTPLHIAAKLNDYESTQLLLKYNPIKNILNNNNETPLDIIKNMKNIKNEKEKNQVLSRNNNIRLNELNLIDNNLYKTKNLEFNNKSILNNFSVNNCSLDTKNDTNNNQSLNIYKKKIVGNNKIYDNNKFN